MQTGKIDTLRLRTATWYECKVTYEKTQEDGSQKKVSETYVVDALSFTEAEGSILLETAALGAGDINVAAISLAKYTEVFFSDLDEDDLWFKARIAIVTVDEKTAKEKRSYLTYLVQACSLERARWYIDEMMGSGVDFEVKSISETKILDVFEHQPS